jgi:glycosyltransferase involved in cell wall biosynthesis
VFLTSLSIIIPAYNEEARLPSTLDAVARYLTRSPHAGKTEVLVVDDGSRDGTATLVENYRAGYPSLRLLRNPGNRGKGYSVRHGMLEACGQWRLFTDADLSAPIEELDFLLRVAERDNADIVIGSRALDRSLIAVHQSWSREYSGRVFNLFMRMMTGLPFRDTQCGFKLFSAHAAESIFPLQQLDRFSFDVEDLVIARSLGLRVIETPVRWSNVEGTKVSAMQGLNSFADVLRIRWYKVQGRYHPLPQPAASGSMRS